MKRLLVLVIGMGAALLWACGRTGTNDSSIMTASERTRLHQAGSEELVDELRNPKRDIVMTALNLLEERRDAAGIPAARDLLTSTDDYIWFSAALYLGAMGESEAVPYLIKGLKHPASRAYVEVASELRAFTGQEFGTDQARWIQWWKEEHPESTFDFSYPDLLRKALEITPDRQIYINDVFDPVTIGWSGVRIVLIGIRRRDDADPDAATKLLSQLVLGQYVRASNKKSFPLQMRD